MEHTLIVLLRAIHIVCGVFWVGAAVTIAAFLEPTVRALGPEGGRFMAHMIGPARFRTVVTTAGFATVIAGILLLFILPAGGIGQWLETPYGHTILAGAVLGIVGLSIGASITGPTASKIGALVRGIQASGGPPTPEQSAEIARLQKRMRAAGRTVAVLLLLAVLMMATARYI